MKTIRITACLCFFIMVSAGITATETLEEHVLKTYAPQSVMAIKSGTPAMMEFMADTSPEAMAMKAAASGRPELDAFADSERGHFRVHYDTSGFNAPDITDDDGNGVPDYVDSTLVYLEHAWDIIVRELAYGAPAWDGTLGGTPNDMVDCYIVELSKRTPAVYGLTKLDDYTGVQASSYIEIDNGFDEDVYNTKGLDALKITTAHEFFHVIHFTYFRDNSARWWMEQTAVWVEDRVWDDVNDYINYVGEYYTDRDISLDSQQIMYGATVYAFHIAEYYGESMIRKTWDSIKHEQSGRIELFNSVLPEGLPKSIADLALWMYFTGYRSNTSDFFSESDLIRYVMKPDAEITNSADVDSLSLRHYAFKYVEYQPKDGLSYGDTLYVDLEDRDDSTWRNRLLFYASPRNYTTVDISTGSNAVFVERPFEKAVLILTNTSQLNKSYRMVYSFTLADRKGIEDESLPSPIVLSQNTPNPFNGATSISYTLGKTARVSLKIYNLQGATVATLVDAVKSPGYHTAVFAPDNLASGAYIAVLDAGGLMESRKMLYVK